MEKTFYSLEDLINAYRQKRPNEVPTLYSIMKNIVLPRMCTPQLRGAELSEFLRTLPAISLYGLLNPERNAWQEEISRRLPEGETYQKAYLRAIKRLIRFAERAGQLHPDQYEISPQWNDLIVSTRAVGLASV
jgi:hypothetical protein